MNGEAASETKLIGPGDAIGAARILDGSNESGELRMVADGRVFVVGRREFSSLLRRVPGFAAGVAKELATR